MMMMMPMTLMIYAGDDDEDDGDGGNDDDEADDGDDDDDEEEEEEDDDDAAAAAAAADDDDDDAVMMTFVLYAGQEGEYSSGSECAWRTLSVDKVGGAPAAVADRHACLHAHALAHAHARHRTRARARMHAPTLSRTCTIMTRTLAHARARPPSLARCRWSTRRVQRTTSCPVSRTPAHQPTRRVCWLAYRLLLRRRRLERCLFAAVAFFVTLLLFRPQNSVPFRQLPTHSRAALARTQTQRNLTRNNPRLRNS
jgi:hypothetical protein